jgi:hypothetical protein
MAEEKAPDPARVYERAKPEKESGMGRLDNNVATPTRRPDKIDDAVKNRQPPRQINAEDERQLGDDARAARPLPEQPDHSMHEEEPLGWDQAPTDIHNPREKRHPRKEGKGGTP